MDWLGRRDGGVFLAGDGFQMQARQVVIAAGAQCKTLAGMAGDRVPANIVCTPTRRSCVIPTLLRAGINFWLALGIGCAVTVLLYLVVVWSAPRLGINI